MGDLLCGADLGDGYTCAVPAGQGHTHDDAVIAKGLDQVIRREMAAAYADPEAAALLKQTDQMVPARGLAEALAGATVELDVCVSEGRTVPEVDFRAMLGDDTQAWATRTRLAETLGRRYLATALVDQLTPETSAALADRLQSLVSQAVSETEMKINADVARATHETITNIRTALDLKRDELRKEVSRERFGRGSRLD
jgi:hypothetical protein